MAGGNQKGQMQLRCNLGAAIFPFATELWGRTIIVNTLDENYDRYNAASADKDKGVPQVFYMHNCMPILSGFQSVGYQQLVNAQGGATTFDELITLRDTSGQSFIFSPCNNAPAVYNIAGAAWTNPIVSPSISSLFNITTTVGTVNGQSYIFFSSIGAYTYTPATNTIDGQTIIGIDTSQVIGISSANGYLLLYTATGVYRSSTTNPLDFTPSIQTGAGGGDIQEVKGTIVIVYPISGGFLIYATKNIVAASYTGNIQYPFIFREVPGSSGIIPGDYISYRSNTSPHFAFTTAGLMVVDLNSCRLFNNEIADFISSCLFEDFDAGTQTFSSTLLSQHVYYHLNYIAQRYLVISYGVAAHTYTHAIVYDNYLGRYGKLKFTHVDCFDLDTPTTQTIYQYNSFGGAVLYSSIYNTYGSFATTLNTITTESIFKKTFCFLKADGSIYNIDFDINSYDATNNSVFVLGKFQYARNWLITHQGTDVETVYNAASFTAYLLQSLNGKDISSITAMYQHPAASKIRSYDLRQTGLNLSLMFVGSFNLTSVIFGYTIAGKR